MMYFKRHARYRAVEPQRHSEAGSSWSSWPEASYQVCFKSPPELSQQVDSEPQPLGQVRTLAEARTPQGKRQGLGRGTESSSSSQEERARPYARDGQTSVDGQRSDISANGRRRSQLARDGAQDGVRLSTLNPQSSTLNPQPSTLNPQPSTLNPQR